MVRPATPEDLDRLVEVETASFELDRLSRAGFRRLLRRPSALVLVEEESDGGPLRGVAVLLFRRGLVVARLYSLAVLPAFRGRGVGAALVDAAQSHALERDCLILRLEVREDNAGAVALYERLHFQRCGRTEHYYADSAAALRFERSTIRPPGLDTPGPGGD
jgi:ribosomal protein S18 acetylase RimI-like enzyme